jgi:hypothetical protein
MKKVWSLKTKFVVISTILTVLMIVILVIFTISVYLNGIKSLEIETVETNIDRGRSAYNYLLDSYNRKLNDWAEWDDTYRFMDDFNKDYVSSNLNDSTLKNLNADEMLFYNTDFELKYSAATDRIFEIEKDFPEDVSEFFVDNKEIADELKLKGEITGIIKTEDGELLYGAQRIVKSDGSGEPKGYLMFGRYLGDWIEKDLSQLVQLPIKIDNSRVSETPYGIPGLDINKNDKIYGHFEELVQNTNKPIVFEMEMERNIWKVGYQGAIYQTIIISILSLVIGFLNYIFLKFVILKDISKFKDDVVYLSKDSSSRLNLDVNSTNLEIRVLQESVSKLISELNKAKNESDDKAIELNKINNLMVGRELKMAELKEIIADLKKKII